MFIEWITSPLLPTEYILGSLAWYTKSFIVCPLGIILLLVPCAPACDFFIFFFQYLFYLFTWLHQVLVAPWGIFFFFFFSQLQHVGSSFLTRDWTQAPALGVWSLSHWTTKEVPLACDYWQICSSCPSGPILILLHYLECPALLYLAPDHLLLTKSQLRISQIFTQTRPSPESLPWYTHTHTHTHFPQDEWGSPHWEPLTHMSIISLLQSSMMICWVCLQFYTINVLKSWAISSF